MSQSIAVVGIAPLDITEKALQKRMAETRTYKSISECNHAKLGPDMGGCPDCNYTVLTILAVTEEDLAQARAQAAGLKDALVHAVYRTHENAAPCEGCRLIRTALAPL